MNDQTATFVRMINPLFRHLTQAIVVTGAGVFLKVSSR
jgi:hypothetical protein